MCFRHLEKFLNVMNFDGLNSRFFVSKEDIISSQKIANKLMVFFSPFLGLEMGLDKRIMIDAV